MNFGNNGETETDSPSGYDGFDEEVIYSQESQKSGETFMDFVWGKNRFVEYRSPLIKKNIITWEKNLVRFRRTYY